MKDIWWINPGKLTLLFVVPVYLLVVFVVPSAWPELIVLKSGFYIHGWYALYGLFLLTVLGVCGLIGARVTVDARQSGSSIAARPLLLAVFGVMIIAAYVIWFYPVLLTGKFTADRRAMNVTPGITSFTQLGVPFTAAYLSSRLLEGERFTRLIRAQFWLILGLTLVRVQLWGERLAIIEVAVPLAVLVLTHQTPRSALGRFTFRIAAALGPFLGIPVLLAAFTLTEYFRSWTVYSQTQNIGLVDFMVSRLVTYYFTALNNGAGMLVTQEGRWPTFDFYNILAWMYTLPLGIGAAAQELLLRHGPPGIEFLVRWADVEFNNLSGVFPIVYDIGFIGAALYFSVFGFVAGIVYRSMVNGRVLGLLFYGPIYVASLEVLRISYLNGSRAVLVVVGSAALYFQARTSRAYLVRQADFTQRSRPA